MTALLHVTPLWNGNVTSVNPAKTALYTVPAGDRVVVRQVLVRNLDASTGRSFFIYVDTTIVATLVATSGGSAGGTVLFQPWIVLGPGQVLNGASQVATGFGVNVGGSLYTI